MCVLVIIYAVYVWLNSNIFIFGINFFDIVIEMLGCIKIVKFAKKKNKTNSILKKERENPRELGESDRERQSSSLESI